MRLRPLTLRVLCYSPIQCPQSPLWDIRRPNGQGLNADIVNGPQARHTKILDINAVTGHEKPWWPNNLIGVTSLADMD